MLLLRIEAGRRPGSVGRRCRGLGRDGTDFSAPEVRGRGRYIDCGLMRGDGGKNGTTGISETRLMVALWRGRGVSSSAVAMEGVVLVDSSSEVDSAVSVSFDAEALISVSRGTSSPFSNLPSNMRDSRSRGFPRVRDWLDRDLAFFKRELRELMKTRVGRVGGSIRVIFFAIWISAFSTEKIDDGEDERDLSLAGCGGLGET